MNLAHHKGNTLVMLAFYIGNAATTRTVLERGAEVDCRNDRGQMPLGGVAFKGYEESLRCSSTTARTLTPTTVAA